MAQVGMLVTWKKWWGGKKTCDLKDSKVGRWTFKFFNWLIKTYRTSATKLVLLFQNAQQKYRCLQIYFENVSFPILFYYNLLCFAIGIQNSLIQNGIISDMNNMLSFNWSQLMFKTEMSERQFDLPITLPLLKLH